MNGKFYVEVPKQTQNEKAREEKVRAGTDESDRHGAFEISHQGRR